MVSITHSKPWITDADREALNDVLATGMLAQGDLARELEHTLSSWVKCAGGVAAGSGSAALVMALHGVGVRAGDEVVLPSYVCRSVLEAVLAAGGVPILCDIGKNWVITADCAAKRITSRTKAVIVPHMYGIFADIESFRSLRVPLIEDCAQALDGDGRRSVSADVAVFSFHPTKCLTAGEGGMAVSPDPGIVARMRALRDGTKSMDQGRLFSPLSDISASLALSQLRRYAAGLARRAQIACAYLDALDRSAPDCLNRQVLERSMFFRFPVRIKGGLDACQEAFLRKGIHVRRGVDFLLHRSIGYADTDFPLTVDLFRTTVSLPIYPALTAEEVDRCVGCAAEVLGGRA